MARSVKTRTSTQCRSHAQKFIVQLDKKGLSLDEVLESDEFVEFNEKGVKVDLSNSYDLMSDNIKSFKLLKGKQEKSSDLNDNAE